ncbi:MAG: nucleoside deaminase [Coleofasciculaceae cyanobacterium RL_1_1]|nr:nucleoside deaminase [Coleofasciculaceae cyanobacterium RL_1_1]
MIEPVDHRDDREDSHAIGVSLSPTAQATLGRHEAWMQQAIALAIEAGSRGEIPVGAIVVNEQNEAIATGMNRRETDGDPTAHAEIVALRAAGRALGSWRLDHCTLYVTLEPCLMCAGAIVMARLGLLVYGADDLKAGAVRSIVNIPDCAASNHAVPTIGGILDAPCRELLQRWFQERRRSS